MPRLARLRVGVLEDLAEQLRYTPRETLRRQLERIERLAGEIDSELNYPEDWVVFRITGYRPEIDEPATIVGAALLGDLSALVERLSAETKLRDCELTGEVFTVESLCERWSVSRKTLDRYRRRGLIAHRVRDERGIARLVFTRQAVLDFERRFRSAIEEARAFRRRSIPDEARLYAIASRAARRFGWSLAETVRRLTERYDAGRDAVRAAILRADDESASPVVPRRRPLDRRSRRVMWRAWSCGAPVAEIGERFGRSAASVHRVVNERRAELLRTLDLEAYASGPRPAERAELLRHPAVLGAQRQPAARTLEEFVDAARSDPIPNRHIEHTIAAAHRLLLREALEGIGALPRYNPGAAALDEIETGLRRAALLRAALVRSQRRLVMTTIEGRLAALASLPPRTARQVHAAAMDALIEAAAAFDPLKGGRLAATSGLFLNRAVARYVAADTGDWERRRAATVGVKLEDWTDRVATWSPWLDLAASLRALVDTLEAEERDLIRLRYGLGAIPPRTLDEAARMLGGARAGLARRERAALRRLRRRRAGIGDE